MHIRARRRRAEQACITARPSLALVYSSICRSPVELPNAATGCRPIIRWMPSGLPASLSFTRSFGSWSGSACWPCRTQTSPHPRCRLLAQAGCHTPLRNRRARTQPDSRRLRKLIVIPDLKRSCRNVKPSLQTDSGRIYLRPICLMTSNSEF
jgi:hypothetical protein